MADTITRKELYEMFEKRTKEERDLRHDQTERFTVSIEKLTTKMENGFKDVIKTVSSTYATKEEVENLKEKVEGHSGYFKWVITSLIGLIIAGIGKALGLY